MTGITKLEASILWGNGFKLQDNNKEMWNIIACGDIVLKIESEGWCKSISFKEVGTDYHIICHSLDKLTQPIMHEGKEITALIEIAKIAFPDKNDWYVEKKQGGYLADGWLTTFYYENGSFVDGLNKYVPNQPALFAYMDSLHFDRFGWSERGLTTEIK